MNSSYKAENSTDFYWRYQLFIFAVQALKDYGSFFRIVKQTQLILQIKISCFKLARELRFAREPKSSIMRAKIVTKDNVLSYSV